MGIGWVLRICGVVEKSFKIKQDKEKTMDNNLCGGRVMN
jgi:hypothetical protein